MGFHLLTSVEFYVTALIFAAAIVVYFAKPSSKGAARQFMLPCKLSLDSSPAAETPSVTLETLGDGTVVVTRHGVTGLSEAGSVTLAIELRGFDMEIKERISVGSDLDLAGYRVNTATVKLNFLAIERYHIFYTNPEKELVASLSYHNRPGMTATRELK